MTDSDHFREAITTSRRRPNGTTHRHAITDPPEFQS